MKKSFLFFILMIILYSCTTINSPQEPTVLTEYALIKMDDSLLNKIIVSPLLDSVCRDYSNYTETVLFYNTDTLCLSNSQVSQYVSSELIDFANQHLGIIGTNPYTKLDNGYVLVNWKWKHFHPMVADWIVANHINKKLEYYYSPNPNYNNGRVLNEKFYLIDEQWGNITNISWIWSISKRIELQRKEIRYISIKALDEYRGSQSAMQRGEYYMNVLNAFSLYSSDIKKYKEYIILCDSMENIYINTLNKMIRNNDFDKYYNK